MSEPGRAVGPGPGPQGEEVPEGRAGAPGPGGAPVAFVDRTWPLPDLPGFAEHAAAPPSAPAAARPAATVMLVRAAEAPGSGAAGAAGGVEVFMLRRVPTMAFAPDTWVFPGGGVDARDAATDLPWAGPSPARWAAVLGCDEAAARGLVVAAAREVFEECGVLLAGPDAGSVVGDLSAPAWSAARARVEAREVSFAQFLAEAGLVLRTDLLRAHARWITPEVEPRRYDTAFFAALVPPGQRPDDATSEAAHADWTRPADVLAAAADGRATVLPPTVVALERLAAAAGPEAFVAAAPPYVAVLPTVRTRADGSRELHTRVPVEGP